MTASLYVGSREGPACHVWRCLAGKWTHLPPRQCRANALPTDFDWRNDSPGSFALALALAGDLLDDAALAVVLHLDFWRAFVRTLPLQIWAFREDSLKGLLCDLHAAQTRQEGVPLFRRGSYRPHPVRHAMSESGRLIPTPRSTDS